MTETKDEVGVFSFPEAKTLKDFLRYKKVGILFG